MATFAALITEYGFRRFDPSTDTSDLEGKGGAYMVACELPSSSRGESRFKIIDVGHAPDLPDQIAMLAKHDWSHACQSRIFFWIAPLENELRRKEAAAEAELCRTKSS